VGVGAIDWGGCAARARRGSLEHGAHVEHSGGTDHAETLKFLITANPGVTSKRTLEGDLPVSLDSLSMLCYVLSLKPSSAAPIAVICRPRKVKLLLLDVVDYRESARFRKATMAIQRTQSAIINNHTSN